MADQENQRVEEFTAWGTFVKAWGWGVATGASELQSCGPEATPPTATCQKGLAGPGAGQFGAISPQSVIVDSTGDVYVVDWANRRVQKFDSEGNFILMFGGGVNQGPIHPGNVCTATHIVEGDMCGAGTVGSASGQFGAWPIGSFLAIGPSDSVHVGDVGRVQRFNANGVYTGETALPGETVQSLAVDLSGNLYVARCNPSTSCNMNAANGTKDDVLKLNSAGATLCTIKAKNPTGIAVSPDTGVYVIANDGPPAIQQFDAACVDKNESFGIGEIERSTGVAAGAACNNGVSVYVSTFEPLGGGANSFVRAYGARPDPTLCPPPEIPPDIESQYAVSVGTDNALLRAEINPHFWLDTTYYVEYGTAKCSESSCIQQPLPPGSLLQGADADEGVTTSGIALGGLQPGVTYHYRFVSQSGGSGGEPIRGVGGQVGIDGEEGTFTTFPLPLSPKGCPNQSFRGGAAARLPDCRAYEMVSPVDKNNGDIAVLTRLLSPIYPAGHEQSSTDGERITFSSATAFGDAVSAPYTSQYIATRTAGDAWSTHAISPPRESKSISELPNTKFDVQYKAFSADLCSGWVVHDTGPTLAPAAVAGFLNLYRRDNCGAGADGYAALSTVEPPARDAGSYLPEVQGFSTDASLTFFAANDKLSDLAIDNVFQLYVSKSGQVAPRYVCLLPNGSPSSAPCSAGTPNGLGESRTNTVARAVSDDGSKVFWTTGSFGPAPLYVRINPGEGPTVSGECSATEPDNGCTLLISAADARFWTAAVDGSKAIYTVGDELFEFDLNSKTSQPIADGVVGVAGADEEASRIYFSSTDVLSGDEENSEGDEAEGGKPNLYLHESDGDLTTFIGTLSAEDVAPSSPLQPLSANPMRRPSRVTPDGGVFAFTSSARLTGYDNTDITSGKADAEVFLYDTQTDVLACISCNPTGARPKGRDFAISNEKTGFWAAAQIPVWANQLYAPRALADSGSRLFFESFEALVPRDTNGAQDVYEWQRAGSVQQCEDVGAELLVASAGGCLSLISSGDSPVDSEFADATPDGGDVFFRTAESLLPQDPGLIDIYDAREEGGLPIPAPPSPPCEGEACQSPPAPPDVPTPSSSSFSGSGNTSKGVPSRKPCPKGKRTVRRNGKVRCVPKKKRRPARGPRRNARPGR